MVVFTAAFLLLHKLLSTWSARSGIESAKGLNEIRNLLSSVGKLSKVLRVSEQVESFSIKLKDLSSNTSKATSDTYFVQQVPKYVLELTVILVGLITALYLSTTSSFGRSVGILTLLVATSFRLLPSLLRIQGAILVARTSIGLSIEVINLTSTRNQSNTARKVESKILKISEDMEIPGIDIKNLCFRYPESEKQIFNNLNLKIEPGTFTVIKGSSGVGKSTLVDLILGILEPDSGQIEFLGVPFGKFKASYMPQETTIINGSIVENIALGIPLNAVDLERVKLVLHAAGLDDLIDQINSESTAEVGITGRTLSGGQYQRIGLARALYPNPGLIILDEPTSALDQNSEEIILKALFQLRSAATIIVIAHSEKPEQFSDNIIFL